MSWHTREFASRAWDHIAQIRDRIDHLPLLTELADGTLEPRRFVEPELSQFSDPGFSRLLLWCRGLCGVGR